MLYIQVALDMWLPLRHVEQGQAHQLLAALRLAPEREQLPQGPLRDLGS